MTEKIIQYSEMFLSIQGEGRFVGVPSVFFRTFGCNFKCSGFGQPRDRDLWVAEEDMPYNTLDVSKYEKLADLPIVPIGCDSSASWSTKYKHLATKETTSEIANKLTDLAGGEWFETDGRDTHLVITGGEPLLGWQRAWPELLSNMKMRPLTNLTFETNGTQSITQDFKDFLWSPERKFHLNWSVSPKLSISGEKWEDAIKPDVLREYQGFMNIYMYLKFVVENKDDFDEMEQAISEYKKAGVEFDAIYAMPVGATQEGLAFTEKDVAELCMERGYRFSPRLHTHLFGNAWGT